MQEYLNILRTVQQYGEEVEGRNGKVKKLFGIAARYPDVGENFPLLTTKAMPFKSILGELLAFLRGEDDVTEFQKLGCNVWNANQESEAWKNNPNYEEGYLGRIYGVQWRDWIGTRPDADNETEIFTLDQIQILIDGIKADPFSRRHIVTAWNPGELDEMCLPPCHVLFQVNISPGGKLDIALYQRSCDMFLGVPFNIASYALLILILARQTGYQPGTLVHFMGDAHIYENHYQQVDEQLERFQGPPCRVRIKNIKVFDDVAQYKPRHFVLEGYEPQPSIKGDMSL